jgi:hypothetical protein
MRNNQTLAIEQLESRQFLSPAQSPPDGPFAIATGSWSADTDDAEPAGHVVDYATAKTRAAGDGPPRTDGVGPSFSLDEALLEMAADFAATLGYRVQARAGGTMPTENLAGPAGPLPGRTFHRRED